MYDLLYLLFSKIILKLLIKIAFLTVWSQLVDDLGARRDSEVTWLIRSFYLTEQQQNIRSKIHLYTAISHKPAERP